MSSERSALVTGPLPTAALRSLVFIVLALFAAAALTLSPLWLSLVLSAWFASLTRPLWARLTRLFGGRPRVAAVLTVVSLLLLVAPLLLAGISLGYDGVEFVRRIATSAAGKSRLVQLVSDQPAKTGLPRLGLDSLIGLLREHGAKAWSVLRTIAGKTATGLVGVFIFLLGAYTLLVDGARFARWAQERSPVAPRILRRLIGAFHETGRGMLVGVGLTGLVQGVVATIAYLVLRIPSALGLGILTAVAALIPSVGTPLVWIPVAGGLALSGRWVAAIILAAIGVLVIGTVDNLLRPLFSRYGRLNLPTFVLFLAIFGGLALYGAAGIVLGPLLVRLGVEALDIARDEGLTAPSDSADEPLALPSGSPERALKPQTGAPDNAAAGELRGGS